MSGLNEPEGPFAKSASSEEKSGEHASTPQQAVATHLDSKVIGYTDDEEHESSDLESREGCETSSLLPKSNAKSDQVASVGTSRRCSSCCTLVGFDYFEEFLILTTLVVSFIVDVRLGITLIILEVIFDVAIGAVLVLRYMKSCSWLWGWLFLINRLVGLAFPIYGFIFLFAEPSSSGPWKVLIRYALLALYTIDLIVDIGTFNRVAGWFVPIWTRLATLQDVDAMMKIEASAYDRDEHRDTREVMERRIITSPGTIFVVEHFRHGVVMSLYMKFVHASDIENESISWYKLNNDGDFTTTESDNKTIDALYIIGWQGLRGLSGMNASDCLIFHCTKDWTKHHSNVKAVFGGLRVPGYHKSNLTLEEYIASGEDKLLNYTTQKVCCLPQPEVIKGIHDYWDDPESRSCAALVKFPVVSYGAGSIQRYLLTVLLGTLEVVVAFNLL
eukprot:gb/GEZN01006378.1/.p1 GENE.gb/GEZN01006378.1/~~gb/GEZN01006378.1/.p1  ORF type:complete len:444 (-),score=21.61 gb/GEZN01006378.1/:77-1408(-)